jgi:hypothetical protein
VDKYLKAVRASAEKVRPPSGASVLKEELSPLTKLVLFICFSAWLVCCVCWAVLPDDAATTRVTIMLLYLCIVASTTVCDAHISTAAVLEGLDFAASQIDAPELLAKIGDLRSKVNRTRRTILVPGALLAGVTGSLLLMMMTPLASELTQRVDYLALTWVPIYVGNLYGHLSHWRAQEGGDGSSRRVTAEKIDFNDELNAR